MKTIQKLKAWALILWENGAYVVYRKRFNDYSLPKGSVEIGETFEQAALREVLEETGIIGTIHGYLDQISYSFEEKDVCYDCEVHYFLMTVTEDKKEKLAEDVDASVLIPIEYLEQTLSYKEDKRILQVALSKYPEIFWNKI